MQGKVQREITGGMVLRLSRGRSRRRRICCDARAMLANSASGAFQNSASRLHRRRAVLCRESRRCRYGDAATAAASTRREVLVENRRDEERTDTRNFTGELGSKIIVH